MIERINRRWAVRAKLINDACADVWAAKLWDRDADPPTYQTFNDAGCSREAKRWEDAEIVVSGWLKFDGCANLKWNQEPTAVHFCGVTEACDLMRLLWSTAAEAMGREDEPDFEDDDANR